MSAPTQPITRGQLAAAVAGNALEFYDFTTYAFFAVAIGHVFFPGRSAFISLMASLVTFGAGFVLRPVGSIVIGRFADRRGRRPAMLLSFTLMGAAILGLALTPSYAAIGPVAPVLAVLWRMTQGFALGGEVGPTTAFIVEAAPPARRAWLGSWQSASQSISSIAGGLVGVILAGVLNAGALEAFGWRIAFVLGGLTLPFGLWLRRRLPETLGHAEEPADHHPQEATILAHARPILLGLGLIAGATVSTYAGLYVTTYALAHLKMKAGVSLAATLVSGVAGLTGALAGGALADRYGRRPILIWPRVAYLLAVWPAYRWMVDRHDPASLITSTIVLGLLNGASSAVSIVAITEGLRKEVRGVAMGATYAIAVAVFGGTTQPALEALIHTLGDPVAPAFYVMGFTVIALAAALLMRETAPAKAIRVGGGRGA